MRSLLLALVLCTGLFAESLQPGQRVLIERKEGGYIRYPGLVEEVNEDGTYTVSFENRDGGIIRREYPKKRLVPLVRKYKGMAEGSRVTLDKKAKSHWLSDTGEVKAVAENGTAIVFLRGPAGSPHYMVFTKDQYEVEKYAKAPKINEKGTKEYPFGTKVIQRWSRSRGDHGKETSGGRVAFVTGVRPNGDLVLDYEDAHYYSLEDRTVKPNSVIRVVPKKKGLKEGRLVKVTSKYDGIWTVVAVAENGDALLRTGEKGRLGRIYERYIPACAISLAKLK